MSDGSNRELDTDDFAGKWPDGIILQVLESQPVDARQDRDDDSLAAPPARDVKDPRQDGPEAGQQSDRQDYTRTRERDHGIGSPSHSQQLSQHSSGRRSRQSGRSLSSLAAEEARDTEVGMPAKVAPAVAPASAPAPDQTRTAGDALSHGASVTSDWGEFCRICHESGEKVPLVTACRCTGSMQHVHNECLIRWILSSFNTHCEICLHRYRIGTTGMRMPHLWKLPVTDGVERYHMLLCVVALVVLAGVISFLIYVSTDEGREARTYRNSPLAPALYAVYAVLGLVCLGLATAELHYTVCPLIERFRLTNMNLLVVPYDPNEGSIDSLDRLSAEYVTV